MESLSSIVSPSPTEIVGSISSKELSGLIANQTPTGDRQVDECNVGSAESYGTRTVFLWRASFGTNSGPLSAQTGPTNEQSKVVPELRCTMLLPPLVMR